MISTKVTTSQTLKPQTRSSLYWTFADAFVLAKRHLVQIPRIHDDLLVDPLFTFFTFIFGLLSYMYPPVVDENWVLAKYSWVYDRVTL